uniref:Uncharacterized protein n=1 Tax=Ciona intestinalis TaxID=7719 RepID=H2XMV8_CIOIN
MLFTQATNGTSSQSHIKLLPVKSTDAKVVESKILELMLVRLLNEISSLIKEGNTKENSSFISVMLFSPRKRVLSEGMGWSTKDPTIHFAKLSSVRLVASRKAA